jgi:transposase InsO family protein
MTLTSSDDFRDRWARLRFSIIGPLLSSPPDKGDLQAELIQLAQTPWKHPLTGTPITFGISTIERWFYLARHAKDPIAVLRNRLRKDAGEHPSLSLALRLALRAQHTLHPSWSYRLHFDNIDVVAKDNPALGLLPSYAVVRRWMKSQGLYRRRRRRGQHTPGMELAETRLLKFEVRSFEVAYVMGLWHADFHVGSLRVITPSGEWVTPHLLGILDDRSRLACHVQWYLAETAQNFAHGSSQAFQKRGLPRAFLSDRGGALTAAEIEQGFSDLGILHELTLPYSPYQNAKQEVFWVLVEGRLIPMLESVKEPTLALFNEATQALVELEYNRSFHSEIGTTPLKCFLEEKSVGRESPRSDDLRRAFRMKINRQQRLSDGTLTVEGVRFEVPNRYRHLKQVTVRAARWDLSSIDMVDGRTGAILCPLYPLDKTRNAEGLRRRLDPIGEPAPAASPSGEIAPLLKKLMAEYAATGLPPAYIPRKEEP